MMCYVVHKGHQYNKSRGLSGYKELTRERIKDTITDCKGYNYMYIQLPGKDTIIFTAEKTSAHFHFILIYFTYVHGLNTNTYIYMHIKI